MSLALHRLLGEVHIHHALVGLNNAILEPGVLATVQAVPVKGWKGPGNQPFEVALRSATPEAGHSRMFGTITLPVALRSRTAALSQYPCTSCHQGRKVVMA